MAELKCTAEPTLLCSRLLQYCIAFFLKTTDNSNKSCIFAE
jgi:hypothetical protein